MCENRKSRSARHQLARTRTRFHFLSFSIGVLVMLFLGALVLLNGRGGDLVTRPLSAASVTSEATALSGTPVSATKPVSNTPPVVSSPAPLLVSTAPTETSPPSIAINSNDNTASENKTPGYLTSIISACISAVVTIFGFVITYFLNKRNFKEAVNKQKIDIHLGKISDLPYTLLEYFDYINTKANPADLLPKFKVIMSLIYAYGSKSSIKIAASMQEANYEMARDPESVEKIAAITYYILLACQTKYDLTGIEISPEYWYRMRMNEYSLMKEKIKSVNNDIVNKLQLEGFMLID